MHIIYSNLKDIFIYNFISYGLKASNIFGGGSGDGDGFKSFFTNSENCSCGDSYGTTYGNGYGTGHSLNINYLYGNGEMEYINLIFEEK